MSGPLRFNLQNGAGTPIGGGAVTPSPGGLPMINPDEEAYMNAMVNQFNADIQQPAIGKAPPVTTTPISNPVTPSVGVNKPSKRSDEQRALDGVKSEKIYNECIEWVTKIRQEHPKLIELGNNFPIWTYGYSSKCPKECRERRPETVQGNFNLLRDQVTLLIRELEKDEKVENKVNEARAEITAQKIIEDEKAQGISESVEAANKANESGPGFGFGGAPADGVYGIDEHGNMMRPEDRDLKKAQIITDVERFVLKVYIENDNLFYDRDQHEGTLELFDSMKGDIDEGWKDVVKGHPESEIVKNLDNPWVKAGVAHLNLFAHEYGNYTESVKRGDVRHEQPRARRGYAERPPAYRPGERTPTYFAQRVPTLQSRSTSKVEVTSGGEELEDVGEEGDS